MVGRSCIRVSFALLGRRPGAGFGGSVGRPQRRRAAFRDVFSHGSEYDVAEQQRPEHDEVAMRSLQLPFEAEVDVVDAIDQRRSVPVDEDDYR